MPRFAVEKTLTAVHSFPDSGTSNETVYAPPGHVIVGGGIENPDPDMHGYVTSPAQQDSDVQSAVFRGWVDGPGAKNGQGFILHIALES